MVRYVGWYSNRMRGDRKKQVLEEQDNEIEIIDVSDYKPRKIPPHTWRECIKKIWEVDPLECPRCRSEMKIISFINERPVTKKSWNISSSGKSRGGSDHRQGMGRSRR